MDKSIKFNLELLVPEHERPSDLSLYPSRQLQAWLRGGECLHIIWHPPLLTTHGFVTANQEEL